MRGGKGGGEEGASAMRTSRPTSLSARGRGRWAAKRGVYEGVRGGVGWAAASEIQMAPKPDFESPSPSSRSPSLDSSSFIYSPSLSSSSATPRFFLSFFFLASLYLPGCFFLFFLLSSLPPSLSWPLPFIYFFFLVSNVSFSRLSTITIQFHLFILHLFILPVSSSIFVMASFLSSIYFLHYL